MAEHVPEVYIDLTSGDQLIGSASVEKHVESGGNPMDIFSVGELMNCGVPSAVSFANIDRRPNRWAKLSDEEILMRCRWLNNLSGADKNSGFHLAKILIGSRLGLIPGRHTIENRFDDIPTFQQRLNAERIIWRDAFKNWDNLEAIIHLHKIGQEEGRRPDIPLIEERRKRGLKEPGHRFIRSRMPLPEAYERAGYTYVRDWDRSRYDEWGVLFYMANDRLATKRELDTLSSKGLGPSSHAVSDEYGSMSVFRLSVKHAFINREQVKADQIRIKLGRGDLPRDLFIDQVAAKEALRRTGRFTVIELLLPFLPRMKKVGLSMYDITGGNFVDYLYNQDARIEDWVVEAAARFCTCYPELFPRGKYIKSLRV